MMKFGVSPRRSVADPVSFTPSLDEARRMIPGGFVNTEPQLHSRWAATPCAVQQLAHLASFAPPCAQTSSEPDEPLILNPRDYVR